MHEDVRGRIQGTLQGMALWQKRSVFRVKLFTIRDKPHVKQILQTPLLDSKSMWPLRTSIQRHCICTTFFRHIFYSYQSNDKKVFLFRKTSHARFNEPKNELYCTCLFLFSCNVHLLAFINKVSQLKTLSSAKITIYWNLFHLILPKTMHFHGKSECNQCSAFMCVQKLPQKSHLPKLFHGFASELLGLRFRCFPISDLTMETEKNGKDSASQNSRISKHQNTCCLVCRGAV